MAGTTCRRSCCPTSIFTVRWPTVSCATPASSSVKAISWAASAAAEVSRFASIGSNTRVMYDSPIYVSGHNGLVGSAIVRRLRAEGAAQLLLRTRKELDLRRQADVERFF